MYTAWSSVFRRMTELMHPFCSGYEQTLYSVLSLLSQYYALVSCSLPDLISRVMIVCK